MLTTQTENKAECCKNAGLRLGIFADTAEAAAACIRQYVVRNLKVKVSGGF